MGQNTMVGTYCACLSVKAFMNLSKDEWLRKMLRGFVRINQCKAHDRQVAAWENCYDVLHDALALLPKTYNLSLVFEYAMPCNKSGTKRAELGRAVRADVILLEKTTAVVMEFKRKRDFFIGDLRQAKKYKTRLQKYHVGSVGMHKKVVYVLTKANGYYDCHYRGAICCSPDKLADALGRVIPEKPIKHANAPAWLSSGFVADPRHKTDGKMQ